MPTFELNSEISDKAETLVATRAMHPSERRMWQAMAKDAFEYASKQFARNPSATHWTELIDAMRAWQFLHDTIDDEMAESYLSLSIEDMRQIVRHFFES